MYLGRTKSTSTRTVLIVSTPFAVCASYRYIIVHGDVRRRTSVATLLVSNNEKTPEGSRPLLQGEHVHLRLMFQKWSHIFNDSTLASETEQGPEFSAVWLIHKWLTCYQQVAKPQP